ncbi:MAG: family 16 glycosylhydrolase, partial [Gammaproteobacteria bacterium]
MRFIQSIDSNQDHRDGITIANPSLANGLILDFTAEESVFEAQLIAAVAQMTGGVNAVIDAAVALDNFCNDTYLRGGGEDIFGFPFVACELAGDVELLLNRSFESSPPGSVGANDWGFFNNVNTVADTALTGSQSLKMFGPFAPEEAAGAFQDFTPIPGKEYKASVFAQNFSGDALDPSNLADMQLVFSSDGNFEDGTGETAFEVFGTSAEGITDRVFLEPNVWTELAVTGKAPLAAVAARFQLLHIQLGAVTGGSIFYDDASVIGPTIGDAPVEYQEVWFDDFLGTSLNPSNWTAELGYGDFGWGNNEWQNYTDDEANLRVEGGNLVITALCGTSTGGGGGGTNALSNAGFELPDASSGDLGDCVSDIGMPDWSTSNCNFVSSNNNPSEILAPQAHEAAQVLRQYGDNALAYQDVPAAPGQMVTASAWAMSWDGGIFNPGQVPFDNLALLQIIFLDNNEDPIGSAAEDSADSSRLTPQDGADISDWTLMEVSAEAPPGTASARVQLKHELSGGSATAPVYWDDASLTVSEPACVAGKRDGSVTSARINTLQTFNTIRYGKIEARIKAPVGKGAWPAFWMLGSNFPDIGWPRSGEIDIMELWTVFGSTDRTAHSTLHWCALPALPDNVSCFPAGKDDDGGSRVFESSLGDDFHIYSVEWNPDRFVFKVDDLEVFRRLIDPNTM